MLILAVIFFMLFTKESLVFFSQEYLKENSIEYGSIEGRLFDGVIIRDLRYKDSVKIDTLKISYNILMFLNPTLSFKSLNADGIFIDVDKILLCGEEESALVAFNISKVDLKKSALLYKGELYSFDFFAEGLSFREKVDITKVELDLNSPYAKAYIKGNINSNELRAKSTISINEKYLKYFIDPKKKLYADLFVSTKRVEVNTEVEKIVFKEIKDLEINGAIVDLKYSFKDDFLELSTKYSALYKGFEADVTHKGLIGFDAVYKSKLEASIKKSDLKVPFKNFTLESKSDKDGSVFDLKAENFFLNVYTNNYKEFIFKVDSIYADISAKAEINSEFLRVFGELKPKKEIPYFEELKLEKFSKVNFSITKDQDEIRADFYKAPFALSFVKNGQESIKGVLKIGEDRFDIEGDLYKKEFKITSNIISLKTLLSKSELGYEDLILDAAIKATTVISYSDNLEIKAELKLPWYELRVDSNNIYKNRDAFFEFVYADKEVTLNKYRVDFKNYKISSQKPSKIAIDKSGDITLSEFWIDDNLLLSGKVMPSSLRADLHLKSDKFLYETKDINLTLRADLALFIDSNGVQKVDGDVTILDGTISYAPQKEYAIGDEDIIIIQDIKIENKMPKRDLNIRISSLKPILYKIKEVEATFTPYITIYQDMSSKMEFLGVLKVHKGVVNISDKTFEVDESEIYFYDELYTNPYLNLNLHYYTLDNTDIEIFITNRVNSPLIIFASNPQMSQDDIISYILFGGSTSSVFDKKDGSSLSSVLLGAGLKNMLNGSTNLKIDTLNILTNEKGTLGYEIGTRFSEKIRLVYKNSEISSLVLQYSLSRSLRVDVDIKETGQGVNIYYVKDFKR